MKKSIHHGDAEARRREMEEDEKENEKRLEKKPSRGH